MSEIYDYLISLTNTLPCWPVAVKASASTDLGLIPAFPVGIFTGRVLLLHAKLYLWVSPFWVRFLHI